MAAIPHVFTERNTTQSTTSTTYQSVTGIAQADSNFITGKKYLIVATAQCGHSLGDDGDWHVIHGSTEFEGSLNTVRYLSATQSAGVQFATVWTAVASEGIDIQFRRTPTAGGTVDVDFVSLLTIQLTDYLSENTDWFFNERTTPDDPLTATMLDGATLTFTPATAGHNWAILPYASYSTTGPGSQTQLNKDAGASLLPYLRFDPNANLAIWGFGTLSVFNLPIASVTFTEQSKENGADVTRLYSNVFALNLNKFAVHAFTKTDADLAMVDTSTGPANYTDALQTVNITPTVTGDVWCLAFFGFDKNAVGNNCRYRVQLDNADQPAGQTTAAYEFNIGHTGNSAGDETPHWLSTMSSVSGSVLHTYDLDGGVSATTSTPAGQQRTLLAVTMELPVATLAQTVPATSQQISGGAMIGRRYV